MLLMIPQSCLCQVFVDYTIANLCLCFLHDCRAKTKLCGEQWNSHCKIRSRKRLERRKQKTVQNFVFLSQTVYVTTSQFILRDALQAWYMLQSFCLSVHLSIPSVCSSLCQTCRLCQNGWTCLHTLLFSLSGSPVILVGLVRSWVIIIIMHL